MAVRLPLMGNFENSVLRPAGSDTVLPQSDRPTALALEVRVAAVRCRLQGRARAALPSSAPDPCSVENDLVVSARTNPPLPNAQNHCTPILVDAIFSATPPIFKFFYVYVFSCKHQQVSRVPCVHANMYYVCGRVVGMDVGFVKLVYVRHPL